MNHEERERKCGTAAGVVSTAVNYATYRGLGTATTSTLYTAVTQQAGSKHTYR